MLSECLGGRQVFKTAPEDPPNSVVDSGIEVLTLVLALIMSESAIDSLQNGISATISTTFLRGKTDSMKYARGMVLVINIIIVMVIKINNVMIVIAVIDLIIINNSK